jgi:hypothetical protein
MRTPEKRKNATDHPKAVRDESRCVDAYFFFRYFTLSSATVMMMNPLKTNCKLVSMPRNVRQ